MAKHKHVAIAKSDNYGWGVCVVNGPDCDCEVAHGGVVWRELCSCGAVRHVESNAWRQYAGAWEAPEAPTDLYVPDPDVTRVEDLAGHRCPVAGCRGVLRSYQLPYTGELLCVYPRVGTWHRFVPLTGDWEACVIKRVL